MNFSGFQYLVILLLGCWYASDTSADVLLTIDTDAELNLVGHRGECSYNALLEGFCKSVIPDPLRNGFWSSCEIATSCDMYILVSKLLEQGGLPIDLVVGSLVKMHAEIRVGYKVLPADPIIFLSPRIFPYDDWKNTWFLLSGIEFTTQSVIYVQLSSSNLSIDLDILDKLTFTLREVSTTEFRESTLVLETTELGSTTEIQESTTETETTEPTSTTEVQESTTESDPIDLTSTEIPESTSEVQTSAADESVATTHTTGPTSTTGQPESTTDTGRISEIIIDKDTDLSQVGDIGSCVYSEFFDGTCKTPPLDPSSDGFWSSCDSPNCEMSITVGKLGNLNSIPTALKIVSFVSTGALIRARYRLLPNGPLVNINPFVDPSAAWTTTTVELTTIIDFNKNSEIIISFQSGQPSEIDLLDKLIFSFPEVETTTPEIKTTEPTTESTSESVPTELASSTETQQSESEATIPEVRTTLNYTASSTTTVRPEKCPQSCSKIDNHGTNWTECAGQRARQPCPNGANGTATWHCSIEGSFVGLPNFTNCNSTWLDEIKIGEGEIIDEEKAKQVFGLITTHVINNDNYFGHEIQTIVTILTTVFAQLERTVSFNEFENLVDIAIEVDASLMYNNRSWPELSFRDRVKVGTEILSQTESITFEFTTKATNGTQAEDAFWKFFSSEKGTVVSAGSQTKSSLENKEIKFPFGNEFEDGSFIQLPMGWAQLIFGNPELRLNFIGIAIDSVVIKPIFSDYEKRDWSSSEFFNGKLMSFSIAKSNEKEAYDVKFSQDNGVKIRFRHDCDTSGNTMKDLNRKQHAGETPKTVFGSGKCRFLNTKTLQWSSSGCKIIRSESMATLCECDHLTSFAVLMDKHNYLGKQLGLEILTISLCSLSTICLLTTIVLFKLVHSTRGTLYSITNYLCGSLLVGNALVLLVVDRNYFNMSDEVCVASAIVVHYTFLTAFMWMGIQGYFLYIQTSQVFNSESSGNFGWAFRVVAFGVPCVLVGATVLASVLTDSDRFAYGGEMFCWLNGAYIWSFLTIVGIVCSANVVVLILTLRAALSLGLNTCSTNSKFRRAGRRTSKIKIRGLLALTALLGLNWIVGFFMMTDEMSSVPAAYVFTVLNASQGILIFVFHCFLSLKIRTAGAGAFPALAPWITPINNIAKTDGLPRAVLKQRNSSPSDGANAIGQTAR